MIKARAAQLRIRRQWTVFGILLTISVVLMGASGTGTAHDLQSAANFAFNPVEGWLNGAADTVDSYWSAITQIDHLRTENDLLAQENQTLRDQLLRMPSIAKLNDDWTKITDTQVSEPYKSTIVRVIVRDITDTAPRTLVIDSGSQDGMVVGQVVIDSGGAVIGRVQMVDANVSTVLLITDTGAVVVGREGQSGATGTIRGRIDGLLQMDNIDVTANLQKGDAVVTAGETLPGTLDRSPYPPGLLIGEIVDVQRDPNAIVQSALIQPAAQPASATFLLVLTDYTGGFVQGTPTPVPATRASSSPKATAAH
jgi:rod shape-determining protein MreC